MAFFGFSGGFLLSLSLARKGIGKEKASEQVLGADSSLRQAKILMSFIAFPFVQNSILKDDYGIKVFLLHISEYFILITNNASSSKMAGGCRGRG
jgi:hypothetical protein